MSRYLGCALFVESEIEIIGFYDFLDGVKCKSCWTFRSACVNDCWW